jgi:ribonuclease HI
MRETDTSPISTIRLLQCNLHKSNATTLSILNSGSENFTALLLQEQRWSEWLKSSLIHDTSWTLIESTTKERQPPRSAIYVNKRILGSSFYEQVHLPFSDVTAIAIRTTDPKPTLVVNIYNPPGRDSIITPLRQYLSQNIKAYKYHAIVMAGDFNLHHPMWNPPNYKKHDSQADELVEMMADNSMRLIIPPGTITYPAKRRTAGTAIDLVWGNEVVENTVLKCQIAEKNDHGSDHLPIETELHLYPGQRNRQDEMPLNYEKTDWDTLGIKIAKYLPAIIDNNANITPADVDQYASEITDALTRAVQETTPRKRISPFSKRWWNDELTEQRKETNHLRNVFHRTGSTWDRKRWKKKRKEYQNNIRAAKERTWRDFVEEADEKTIWMVKKYIDATPTPSYIPTLDGNATTNDEKAEKFQATFFPLPPPADLSDISDQTRYPEPVHCPSVITMRQLENAINKLAPNKAPGPDEISNRVLKKNFSTIQHHLLALAQASMNTGHFPTPFKTTTTVVLRKPMKPDYTKPNAYRPIALENTIGKVLESVIADVLSYLTESYELLPPQHFGGRPGRTAEDAMMLLSERIHRAWKHQEIYSVVFMDVAGAFNNVHHARLIDNMRKRRIPTHITKWVESFLKGRSTQLRFNGITSETIPTPAGTPQGSPLSPILYMYYNGDLLDITRRYPYCHSLGFIDDIAYGIQGQSDDRNAAMICAMLEEAETWRRKHGAQFEKSKYILVHFTRNRRKKTSAPINMADIRIEPSEEARYLGVYFDKELRFTTHLQYIAKKGTKFALAMSSAAKSTWGAQFRHIRQLFIAVVAPRTDYAAIIWHRPNDKHSQATAQQSKLETVQRLAMKTILGCFRTTPTTAMQIETGLIPPHLRLQTKVLRTLTRMQTLPNSHPLKEWIEIARNNSNKISSFPSNLDNLAKQFPEIMTPSETIRTHVRPPWWTPTIDIHIEPTKEDAKEYHDRTNCLPTTAYIYTDGSGIDGNIGAAAVCPKTNDTRYQYLGKETEYNVYAAELCAIQLGLGIIKDNHQYTKCILYTDNQAAIQAVVKPGQQSGQSIILSILDSAEELQQVRPQLTITIVWVPGHEDIPGNELADIEAKKAAQPNGALSNEFAHRAMKSAKNTAIHKNANSTWEKEWENGKGRGQHLRAIMQRPNTTSGPKLYANIDNISRQQLAWLARLRTGHVSLNQYLCRFNITPCPRCACGKSTETVAHFLLRCEFYEEERKTLREAVGEDRMKVEILLGDVKKVKALLKYVETTERFEF